MIALLGVFLIGYGDGAQLLNFGDLCQEKHRHQEWLKFLRLIDQPMPAHKEIY